MPTDYFIEKEDCGAVTVWMGEHEPMDRMKGMVGIRLAPDEAILYTLIRIYNRTPVRRSFLWWENAAVPINSNYRIFFPHDVNYVQFHYRKSITTYPVACGQYNGTTMGKGIDITYHKNTMNPTSYFSAISKYDFFGGYDEERKCGVVHAANHHTSVGKKLFTWAYNQLSESWERALTDTDGAYAELMAGSYSNNQPDFAWLEPYETKKFRQSWYPITAMGIPDCANYNAAVRLDLKGVYIQSTRTYKNASIVCGHKRFTLSLNPGSPEFIPCGNVDSIILKDKNRRVLLQYKVENNSIPEFPEQLPSNPTLETLKTVQDCYLAGVHVEQYRDPAVLPDAYWLEGLKRDPEHIPTLINITRFLYQKGRLNEALACANKCYNALTKWNFNPESGELFYLKGLIYEAQGQLEKAYDNYQKAHWNQDTCGRTAVRIAMIDGRKKMYEDMLMHAEMALEQNTENNLAVIAAAIANFRLDDKEAALVSLKNLLENDPLDQTARYLLCIMRNMDINEFLNSLYSDLPQTVLDISFDLLDAGENQWAAKLLLSLPNPTIMTQYTLGAIQGTNTAMGKDTIRKAASLSFGRAFPWRQVEENILKNVIIDNPQQCKAYLGLGCLLYAKRRYTEAADYWEKAAAIAPSDYMALRNLAVAYYSHLNRKDKALPLLQQSLNNKKHDNQLIWETSYLMTRLRKPPQEKLAFLASNCKGKLRDDIAIEWAQGFNLSGQYENTLELMIKHTFVPCECGEHYVAEQYMFAHHALGRLSVRNQSWQEALFHFRTAQLLPKNLGAGLWNKVLLVPHQYYEGYCLEKLGMESDAQSLYEHICLLEKDFFSDMFLSELPCWQAMANKRLGHSAVAQKILAMHIGNYNKALSRQDPGFFKTTPFFISYAEPANHMREAFCWYQIGLAYMCMNMVDKARGLLRMSLKREPSNLYATLLLTEPMHYQA